jgi:peptidoglycan hydrolase CwlO-like protein
MTNATNTTIEAIEQELARLQAQIAELRAVISATPPRVDTSTKGFNSLEQLKKTIDAPKELCRECANPIEWDDLTRDGFGNPFHKGCMEDQQ